jgi:hypothetical protein
MDNQPLGVDTLHRGRGSTTLWPVNEREQGRLRSCIELVLLVLVLAVALGVLVYACDRQFEGTSVSRGPAA